MTIKEFINALKKAKYWKEGKITFYLDDEIIELDEMKQSHFDFTDVSITFKKLKG